MSLHLLLHLFTGYTGMVLGEGGGLAEGASPQKVKLHRHRCEVYKVPKRGVLIQIKFIYRTGIKESVERVELK